MILSKFESVKLKASGINLHIKKTDKFKTNHIMITLRTALSKDSAHFNALIPMVLKRGTRKCSETIELEKKLENMYGAGLRSNISKIGEVQLVVFGVDILSEKYLPYGEDLLKEAIELLNDVVFDPAMDGSYLRNDYVEQEKFLLLQTIDGLIDDKQTYSTIRCVEKMCENEKFGISKYGKREDVEKITRDALSESYYRLLKESKIDIFVTGDVDTDNIVNMMDECFTHKAYEDEDVKGILKWTDDIGEIRNCCEEMDVNQGKLVIGCRVGTKYQDDDYSALVVMNGILGAYPHSKLFQNVREKNSLAYYAYSTVETVKGIMLMSSGIDSSKKDEVQGIMIEQLKEMQKGNITETEMEFTKKAIITRLKTASDYPTGDVDNLLAGLVTGKYRSFEKMIEEIQDVTFEDVVRVANGIEVDIIYFLSGGLNGNGTGGYENQL